MGLPNVMAKLPAQTLLTAGIFILAFFLSYIVYEGYLILKGLLFYHDSHRDGAKAANIGSIVIANAW
jgi:hypothetical protein